MAAMWLGRRSRLARFPGVMVPVACLAAALLGVARPGVAAGAVHGPPKAPDHAWAIQKTPDTRLLNGTLAAVSCSTPSACIAVGSYVNSSSGLGVTLAERWNGTAWAIQPTPKPSSAPGSALDGVSCTAASACTAVGSYTPIPGGQPVTLAEHWNGTTWTIQPTPNPAGAQDSALTGVSCTAATACTAVGYYKNSSGHQLTLAERWNGSTWTIQPTPNPAGARSSALTGVSCTGATACTSVGSYINGSDQQEILAERWDGTTWVIQPISSPSGVLDGVSCTTANACTAVGWDYSSSGTVTLAERWNGSTWAIQPTPNPAGAQDSYLYGVSCATATACTAVGPLALAEHWDGSTWAIQPTPDPAGAQYSYLDGVSCTVGSACTAVGYYDNSSGQSVTLAERWNGSTWAIQPTPNPPGARGSFLNGVSCTTATACTTVGYFYDNSGGRSATLAERWNGSTWAIQPTPNPAGAVFTYLDGVSCTTASTCTAVGWNMSDSSNAGMTLAERWNGTAWAIQPTPNPPGALGSVLDGVSCTAASACTAVGYYDNSSNVQVTLAEHWNGAAWTIQPTPNPTGATVGVLDGVWCTAASACTAVGHYKNSSGAQVTLAEHWNGTAWTIQPTPNPADVQNSFLDGVSCTTASACTAVGEDYNSAGPEATLAERWNGSAWAIQPTPSPSGALGSFLDGVSCTTATACTAVGSYTASSGQSVTLAERWNGTGWAIQPTPNRPGAMGSFLDGVSCTTATACTAAGGYYFSNLQRTLAEAK